jgi:hypothetical protein
MKIMVKLAVLFATLLLISSVAFAGSGSCGCYEITATAIGNPEITYTETVEICLNYEEMVGEAYTTGDLGTLPLALFRDLSLNFLAYADYGICGGSFKFHGSHNNVITGIGYCVDTHWTIWGHRTDTMNCGMW